MRELNPFILHAALDVVEDVQWSTNGLFLKVVDNFYSYFISAFVTAGSKYREHYHSGSKQAITS